MIPLTWHFGRVVVPVSGLIAAAGVVSALFLARATAKRLDVDPDKVWNLGVIGIVCVWIGSRLLLILLNWTDFRAHPLWMLGLISVRSRPALLGGAALAIAGGLAYARYARLPFRRTLDALAVPFALASTAFSVAALLHRPPGESERIVDCMVSTLVLLVIGGLLVARAAGTGRFRDGEIMGAWLFLAGVSGSLIDALWTQPSAAPFNFVRQGIAMLMVLAGGALWFVAPKHDAGPFQ